MDDNDSYDRVEVNVSYEENPQYDIRFVTELEITKVHAESGWITSN